MAKIAVRGKKIVYLYRVYGTTDEGKILSFVTENAKTITKDADSTVTKDGTVRTPSEAEIEITTTTLLAKGDTVIKSLEEAMLNDSLMEIWEANLEEAKSGNKFQGTYYQGYITSLEKSSGAEDSVEISLTFGINGKGADGDVTVTTEQQDTAAYVFTDSVAKS